MTFERALQTPLPWNQLAHDRRQRCRLRLAYPIRLNRSGSHVTTEVLTENISSDGFFCLTRHPFTLRETIHCELVIPAEHPNDALEHDVVLRYKAEVVRVVRESDGSGFGIGCRLIP